MQFATRRKSTEIRHIFNLWMPSADEGNIAVDSLVIQLRHPFREELPHRGDVRIIQQMLRVIWASARLFQIPVVHDDFGIPTADIQHRLGYGINLSVRDAVHAP